MLSLDNRTDLGRSSTGWPKRSHILAAVALISVNFYLAFHSSSSPSLSPAAIVRSSGLLSHAPPTPHAPIIAAYCPHSTKLDHVPTVILQADAAHNELSNRTFQVPSDFLPYEDAAATQNLRFAQRLAVNATSGAQPCQVHAVPSSPPPAVPATWNHNSIMFGMSTNPDRVLHNLPVWAHWLPSAPKALTPTSEVAKDLPLVLVLVAPLSPTEQVRYHEAVDEAQVRGMNVQIEEKESRRFETRYFALTEEMWNKALEREEDEGITTEWFAFA